jgi:hypothetical protein
MTETAQQYIARILSNIDGKDPLKVQKSTAKRLGKLVKPLSKKELKRRPEENKWSVAEILAHLADAELVCGWRLRLILSNSGTPIGAYDQNAWAETFAYGDCDAYDSLRAFRFLRERNLQLLKSVPPKLWNNYGMHAERGKETVAQVVRMFAGHDLNHIKQIEQIVEARNSKKKKKK